VPVMFGCTVHLNGYDPAASAGTSYFATVTPVTTGPMNTWAPDGSLISTLCRGPESPVRNSIVNGASAGACTSGVVNWMLCASMTTSPPAPALPPGTAVGPPDASRHGAAANGPPDAAPGAPEAPADATTEGAAVGGA